MNTRDRLIELFSEIEFEPVPNAIKANLKNQFSSYALGQIVNQLIANGVGIAEDATTTDAVEVVHGEWRMGESGVVYFCSQCRCAAHPRESERWKYCPHCGAKMDGVSE